MTTQTMTTQTMTTQTMTTQSMTTQSMTTRRLLAVLASITFSLSCSTLGWSQQVLNDIEPSRVAPRNGRSADDAEVASEERIANIPIIDAHCHYAGEHPMVIQWMTHNNVKLLNIATGGMKRVRADRFSRLAARYPGRFAWCTYYDLPDFKTPDYSTRVIRQLEQDFAQGAVACKVWKYVGMSLQRPNGQYVQMDDPIFDDIYAWLSSHGHTLIAHVADPIACWRPLTADNPYRHYYSKHPEWHMYGRTDRPHHSEIISARDHVIERYPALRIVGAHLGSLEFDVDQLAKRFDKYPNFAVDTSGQARIGDLGRQDRDKVRAFFIKYQDRIMFGTDRGASGQLKMSRSELKDSLAELTNALQLGWDYYATEKTVMIKDQPCRGLALPVEVLRKLFAENAKRWFPSL